MVVVEGAAGPPQNSRDGDEERIASDEKLVMVTRAEVI